jgi:DNA (cytosine-5)-methyltransferase 1
MPLSDAKKLTVGSLFAGIGGFDLAAERAGLEVKWQVEIDDYATRVLEKHWPNAKRYRDIRAIDWSSVEPVDLVCGGFPCQPHSVAGKRKGSEDRRDLWGDFAEAISCLRPRWVLAENVPGLLSSDSGQFFGRVLRDLAALGFDAEWECIPASAVGANHKRDRLWLVAHASRELLDRSRRAGASGRAEHPDRGSDVADADSQRQLQPQGREREEWRRFGYRSSPLAHAHSEGPQERFVFTGVPGQAGRDDDGQDAPVGSWWAVEPGMGRVAHGIPDRTHRLKCLGNAIVPQVAEWIFRRIIEAERRGIGELTR